MSFLKEPVRDLLGRVLVVLAKDEENKEKEIVITVKDVIVSLLDKHTPTSMEIAILYPLTKKILEDKENFTLEELEFIFKLLRDSNLSEWRIIFSVLELMGKYYKEEFEKICEKNRFKLDVLKEER